MQVSKEWCKDITIMVKEKKKNMKKSILEMEIFLHNFYKIKMLEKMEYMMVEKEKKEIWKNMN